MSNFRKTRKRGGVKFTSAVHTCDRLKSGLKSAIGTCKRTFASKKNFTIVPIDDDGDCFFTSLSEYGKRENYGPLNKDPLVLRKILVDNLINNFKNIKYFISGETNEDIDDDDRMKQLETLKIPGVWNQNIGDIVPQYASNVFYINIDLYDVKDFYKISKKSKNGENVYVPNESIDDRIDLYRFEGPSTSNPTVQLLRVNNAHFELLWPKGKPIKAKKPTRATGANKPNNLAAVMGAMKLNTRRNKSRSRTSSLERNLEQIALMESREAAIAATKAAKEATEAVKAVEAVHAVRGRRGKPKVAPTKNILLPSSFAEF